MKINFLTILLLSLITLQQPQAIATIRIQFSTGSYCGGYTGQFKQPLVLKLKEGQKLVMTNLGRGELQITMNGFTSGSYYLYPEQTTTVAIISNGDYYFSILSTNMDNIGKIEFCAF